MSFVKGIGRGIIYIAYAVWFLFLTWLMVKFGGWFFFGAPV